MAGASLLALIDDIASVLDDVALMTKVAAKKTAGVLGDDLALNAQQVSGVRAERELPVVWAVAVGSFKNKLILVPAALAISRFIPWAVTPLLMIVSFRQRCKAHPALPYRGAARGPNDSAVLVVQGRRAARPDRCAPQSSGASSGWATDASAAASACV